jgi:hypothetical protein
MTRKHEAREWDDQHSRLVDLSAFQRDILPLIQDIPLSRLQEATGLSLRYVSLIRRGERTPHPRHWEALLGAVATRPSLGRLNVDCSPLDADRPWSAECVHTLEREPFQPHGHFLCFGSQEASSTIGHEAEHYLQ